MNFLHLRTFGDDRVTLGEFFMPDDEGRWRHAAYTCEDPWQPEKIQGNTRIPAGTYKLALRSSGGMDSRYRERFPDVHAGMIHITGIPNFEWVYYHIGNTPADTRGCPLWGTTRNEDAGSVGDSRRAYLRVYPKVADAIMREDCWVTIASLDRVYPPVSEGKPWSPGDTNTREVFEAMREFRRALAKV